MTVEQFKSVLHAKPFIPFTIHMGDGRAFRVNHPDFVARSPSGRTIILYNQDESHSILDLLLMTELEVHSSEKPGAAA